MALEVSETLNNWGVQCNLITGEERRMVEGAKHSASTIEMLSLNTPHDLCIIDEAQMLGDTDRGWAWTQALLGVQAQEVCVIAAPQALPILEKLLKLTGDAYDVVHLERLSPLEMLKKPVKELHRLHPGTALIAFSRSGVLGLKEQIERATGQRAAVLYGALPPEIRRQQAALFASGEAPYLAASDAIGMGLNLPIKTLLFTQDRKFFNQQEQPLTPMAIRQIAGRAGRYGKNEVGYVGTFRIPMEQIRRGMHHEPTLIKRAHLAPNLDHIQAMAALQSAKRPSLTRLFSLFLRAVKPDPAIYRLSDLEDQMVLARITDRHRSMSLETRFILSAAPVATRSLHAMRAFTLMTKAVARSQPFTLDDALEILNRRQLSPLAHNETAVRIVNLYCWLHYRFPECFPKLTEAEQERRIINLRIEKLLDKGKQHAGMRQKPRGKRSRSGRRR